MKKIITKKTLPKKFVYLLFFLFITSVVTFCVGSGISIALLRLIGLIGILVSVTPVFLGEVIIISGKMEDSNILFIYLFFILPLASIFASLAIIELFSLSSLSGDGLFVYIIKSYLGSFFVYGLSLFFSFVVRRIKGRIIRDLTEEMSGQNLEIL